MPERRPPAFGNLGEWPAVAAVVPARNETRVIERTLSSLRRQDYPGRFEIVLIDDASADATAYMARRIAEGAGHPLHVADGASLPTGWAGKVWAMAQGVGHALKILPEAKYIWFTDADLEHDSTTLQEIVSQAEGGGLDLLSGMAMLHCGGFWERLLIPAFVFFFQKLYPFRFVNNRNRTLAAAAGGSMLVPVRALERAGGLERIRSCLIDDCALARLIKTGGPIRLQLTRRSRSVRAHNFADLWNMVARSAYTQLRQSPGLLLLTAAGMILLYGIPPMALLAGILTHDSVIAFTGAAACLVMTMMYLPTIRLYEQSPWRAALLPIAAILYTLMTIDSARRHWQGTGGMWKGRAHA